MEGKCAVPSIRVKHYGHLYAERSVEKMKLYSSVDESRDYSHMIDESDLKLARWVE